MAITFMDNYSMYGTNKALLLNGVYAEATQPFGTFGLTGDPDGSGGIVPFFIVSQATVPVLRYVLLSAQDVCGWAMRVYMDNLPQDNNRRPNVMTWRGAANNQFASCIIETTGRITFSDGVNTVTTTNPVVTANGWYHWEAKYDTSGTGSFELRIEGLPVIDIPSLGYVGHEQVYQIGTFFDGTNFDPKPTLYIKDYVVWDDTSAYNNDFLGSVIVYDLAPTSDVALNWTPTPGPDGYTILDNNPPNDAQFIAAGVPIPAAYEATLEDLPPDVTTVRALQTMVRAAKTDGGDGFLQNSLISDPSGTPATANGADRPITVSFTYWYDVFQTDPKTSAPWLPAAVNDVNMKINRTA